MFIKGVNLGNWLVLEKWMSPHLFFDTVAEDEYYLPQGLSKEMYEARIKTHRAEFITERDFSIIRSWGIDTVRIPVPYFIFGESYPFIGCMEELDNAFEWALKYELKILIDLHTVPYSQNGFDNGGISGVCKWSQYPELVEFTLQVLEKLAKRYSCKEAFWGLEILNEPITEDAWKRVDVPKKYPAADKKMAQGSRPNSIEFIKEFYLEAYKRLRPLIPSSAYIVFHDAFQIDAWYEFFKQNIMQGVILDTHVYITIADTYLKASGIDEYRQFLKKRFVNPVKELGKTIEVICGEWTQFNEFALQTEDFDEQKNRFIDIAQLQMEAWQHGNGYFYWNYKLLLSEVKGISLQGWDSWDLGKCISMGWMSKEIIKTVNIKEELG